MHLCSQLGQALVETLVASDHMAGVQYIRLALGREGRNYQRGAAPQISCDGWSGVQDIHARHHGHAPLGMYPGPQALELFREAEAVQKHVLDEHARALCLEACGQQQRLAVASILALQPRVIILDESTSQLDPIGRDEIFRLVGELHRLGKTVIMVDHNIEKIADTVDKVVVLHEGELVAYDEPHIVFGNKNLLNEHFVRVPQVTDAAIALHDRLSIDGRLPITLQEATPIFALLTQGGV